VLPILGGSPREYYENCSAKQSNNTSQGFELCGLCSFMYDLPEALRTASRSEALVSHPVDRASHAQNTLSSASLGRCSYENQVSTGCFVATHSQEDGARSRKLTSRDLQPPGLSCSQVNPQTRMPNPVMWRMTRLKRLEMQIKGFSTSLTFWKPCASTWSGSRTSRYPTFRMLCGRVWRYEFEPHTTATSGTCTGQLQPQQ
jgi:hypothetical protein